MEEIFEAIKIASKEIKDVILLGDTAKSENENSTGDTQLKLDIASDIIIEKVFKTIPTIKEIVSEEQESIVSLNENGEFLIAYDPLDGSSLVDVNLSVGSIYGIYKDSFSAKNIVASVYVVFGPRVEMVIAYENKVQLFRLSNDEFKYVKDIRLNDSGNLNATGSTQMNWTQTHKTLVNDMFKDGYYLRYSGGMVPDLHQILLKGGGLFSYPGTADKPKGKLRQLFEVFPFAFTYKCAGGDAIDGSKSIFEVETTHIHDTTPCFFGSMSEINRVLKVYSNHG
jgi:fructose-1,6-bisphosphatase I